MLRSLTLVVAIFLSGAAGAETTTVPVNRAQISLSFSPVVKAAAPTVVTIFTKRVVAAQQSPFANDPFFGPLFRGNTMPRVQNALGSGVVLSPDGIVVTNFHVAGQADEIRVQLADRREYAAHVMLADKEADLAILKLDGAHDLPALSLRDSDTIEVGDLVLAIGNPFGIGQTVSAGIVSGLARSGMSVGSGRGYFIQTDAAINPGNSGGALVDMQGRLVGINTAILTRSGGSNGIGFAIPANLVQRFLEQAAAGRTKFERPWAGITAQAVDAALAEGLGMGLPEGVVLTGLHPDSPFAAAGLKVGDVIVSLNGDQVNTPQEMMFRMASVGVGGTMAVRYLHKGTVRKARFALIAPPETPARDPVTAAKRSDLAGLAVVNINPAVTEEYDLGATAKGVLVTDPGTIGARAGLRVGDVLVQVNRTKIRTTRDVSRAIRPGTHRWAIEYLRGGRRGLLRFRL